MDKLTSMQVYCRVAELSSFVKAANSLNLSATMVSKHVALLEKSLGVCLLNRTTRKVSLTEVGAAYYQRCKQLVADLDELEASASELSQLPRGTLRIHAPIDFGAMHMVPMIKAYQDTYDKVAVKLTLDNRGADLTEGNFDISMRVTDAPDPGLVAVSIATTELCTYASAGYLAIHGEPNSIEALREHRCLHFVDTPHGEHWIFNDSGNLHRFKPVWHFSSNNSIALCEAAALGMGIIRAPNVSVAPYVRKGQLEEILRDYRLPAVQVSVMYLPRRFVPVKISSFVSFAKEYFRH